MQVHLMDVEERSGRCAFRRGVGPVSLCPANFVCQVFLCATNLWIDAEGLVRFQSMRRIIVELLERRQRLGQVKEMEPMETTSALQNVTNLPVRLSSK